MKTLSLLAPASLVLSASACMMQQLGPGPRPSAIVLRVTAPDSSVRTGSLILATADSLVLYDLKVKSRFTVQTASAVTIAIYRGQRGGAGVTAKGAGKGALIGAGLGALLGGALAVAANSGTFWDHVDVAEAVGKGAIVGAAEGALVGGQAAALQGEAIWERISMLQLRQELCRCVDPVRTP